MSSKSIVGRAIATAGGAGYLPVAPGTAGTLVAVPFAWLGSGLPLWAWLAVTAVTTVIGIWAAGVADEAWQSHDSGRIVIDEVAGYFMTMALVSRADWLTLAVGFVVFRILDIVKPPPVRWIDEKVGGGAGVVLDDVAAGVMGCAIMYVAATYGGFAALHRWIG
jgi:phosphatidylglycerophosphatase A